MKQRPFDLEVALASWRRTLDYRAGLTEEDRDELAQHIRDQVQALMIAGLSEEKAYRQALREMGHAHLTDAAYRKNHTLFQTLAVVLPMLKNYVLLAFRNLKKNKITTVINIFGLSMALGLCVVVYLYLQNSRDINGFHENGTHTFLVEHIRELGDDARKYGYAPAALGPALRNDFAQVEQMVRVARHAARVYHQSNRFDESVSFADIDFFDLFTFPLKEGSVSALASPNAVILSEEMAIKYFGEASPLGESITFAFGDFAPRTFTIRGVAEAFPSNAGFSFGFLMGYDTQQAIGYENLNEWDTWVGATFVRLRNIEDAAVLEQNLDTYLALQHAANDEEPVQSYFLDNIVEPHPDAYWIYARFSRAPDPFELLFFVSLAISLLALSCFNYVNISLGSAARRLKEIGMRKVMGGRRIDLIVQFLAENILLCLAALVLGVFLAHLFIIPMFNNLFVTKIATSWAANPELYLFLVFLLVMVGFLSGAYPAFYISSFDPIVVFRGTQKFANKKGLTYTFVTIQFVLTFLTVMFGTLYTSFNAYQKSADWGYTPAQTLMVSLSTEEQYDRFRNAALQHPNIVDVTGTRDHVGLTTNRVDVKIREARIQPIVYHVSPAYMAMMGLRLQTGRLFNEQLLSQDDTHLIVNETFVEEQGWSEPLGQMIRIDSTDYTVIGVVEDFQYRPTIAVFLQQAVLFRLTDPQQYRYAILKTRSGVDEPTTAFLESAWTGLFPQEPFNAFEQATVFEDQQRSLDRLIRSIYALAVIALLIACMGLFGLSSQKIALRMKEVGIRKALGASTVRLVLNVNRSYIVLLMVAAGIASVLLYGGILMFKSAFEINLPVGPMPFLMAYAFVFGTAALSVMTQTRKLVSVNPAQVLRDQ